MSEHDIDTTRTPEVLPHSGSPEPAVEAHGAETKEQEAARLKRDAQNRFNLHRNAVLGDFVTKLLMIERHSPLSAEEFSHAVLTIAQREPILRSVLCKGGYTTETGSPLAAQRPITI